MPSLSTFMLIALGVYAFVFLLSRMALSTSQFKQQPVEDQEKARKQFRRTLLLLPFVLAGTYLLLLAPPAVSKALPLVLYVLLWAMVVWLLRRSYRLGIRRDTSLVKSTSGKPLRNAESLVGPFAVVNLVLAMGIAAILIAIPVLRIQLAVWAPLVTAVSSLHTLAIAYYERKNRASP